MKVTADRLRKVLAYDPDTGLFTWNVRQGARGLVGEVAGTISARGYRVINIDKRPHLAHRLAFLYMLGDVPSCVDHIDGDPLNNRWANLRPATNSLNLQNLRHARADSTSGVMGAHRLPGKRERWQARITVHGARRSLGVFKTAALAGAAYLAAKRIHHEGNTL